jgi:hypothetical protein
MKSPAQSPATTGGTAAIFPSLRHRYACRSITTGPERDFLRQWNSGPDQRGELVALLEVELVKDGWTEEERAIAVATGDIPDRVTAANQAFVQRRSEAAVSHHHQWQIRKRQAQLRARRQPAERKPTAASPATPKPRNRSRGQARVTRAGPNSDDPSQPPPNPRHRPAWKPIEGPAESGIARLLDVPTLTRLKRARHEIIEGAWMPSEQRWELLEAALWPLPERPATTYNGYSPGEISTGHKNQPMKAPA